MRASHATVWTTSAAASAAACGALALAVGALACTPKVDKDPVPEAMEFDTEAVPPRVPEPTGLIVNPATRRLDFSLAGVDVPADCASADARGPLLPQAQCEFYQYLESLDGYPTVTPARAPATAPLDPATLTVGANANIVVVSTKTGSLFTDVTPGFDTRSNYLTLRPRPIWKVGDSYLVAVRGYASGVRAASGAEVVGSPTMALLKQDEALGADAVALLESQGRSPAEAMAAAARLEQIRRSLAPAWPAMAAAGLPKDQVAVLWGFPIHSASVAELDPTAGLVPMVTGADQIRIAVQGPVDPTTVSAVLVPEQQGSVLLMDLTAAAAGNLTAAFLRPTVTYQDGAILIQAPAGSLMVGRQYGVFITRAVRNPAGVPLAPSPVSVLLRLRGRLIGDGGHSTVSGVGDTEAALLEAGRQQLGALFDNPFFSSLTGVSREELAYCFAFPLQAP